MTSRRLAWREGLWRWRRWIALVGVLLAVRVALPEILRRVLISQASQALRTPVEIGGIDLSLLRGGIALTEVAIHPSATMADSAGTPLVAWKRLAVALRWLPLLRRTVRLRAVEIESPRLALDRLEDGQLSLLALVPGSAEHPPAAAAPSPDTTPRAALPATATSGWSFGLDRVVLRDGGLRFRDLKVKESEAIEVTLENIEVTDVAVRPGLYREPSHLRLAVAMDEGTLRLDARATLRQGGMALAAELEARNLPLHRARVYIPTVGWSALHGALDAALTYRLESETQHELRGTVTLRDVAVQVPTLAEPALAWRSFRVTLDAVDLVARRIGVNEVDLSGAVLAVRPRGGDLLPFLARATDESAETAPATSPAAATAPAPPGPSSGGPAAAAVGKPWRWSVASLGIADSRVRLLGAATPLDVGVELRLSDLAADATPPARLALALTAGNGSVNVDGSLRVMPPGFAGTVRIAELSLPELVATAGVLSAEWLQAGRLGSELAVEAGLGAPGAEPGTVAATDLRVRGRLSVADLQLAAADPKAFALSTRSLEVPITELTVPGLLPPADPGAAARPIRVALGDLQLTAPTVQLTRTPAGIALPQCSTASPSEKGVQPTSASGPSRRIEVAVDSVRLAQGRVAIADQTVKPFFSGGLSALNVEVRDLRWPDLAASNVRVAATSTTVGTIDIFGALAAGSGWFEVDGEQIALPPFNPYATSLSSYSIARGTASLSTKATFRAGRYNADSWLTLHDFDLQGGAGESLFEQHFGIPLSMALALMRDVHGNIVLGIPVEADAQGAKVDLLAVIGGALRRAIVNALASPLRLVGAVFGGEEGTAMAPAPIAFHTGQSALSAEGAGQLEQLAAFLASRPGVGVLLATSITTSDVRWLREQALREDWATQGVLGTLRGLPQRGTRETIRRALAARASDAPGDLSTGDAATLDRWLDERPPITPERRRTLADARLARIEAALREGHGIEPTRITRRDPSIEPTDGTPVVRIELGTAGR